MAILEAIAEFFTSVIIQGIFQDIPVRIYEWITGKKKAINGYRTEHKKFIKFDVATKLLLTWEEDIDHLKHKLTDGLEEMNEKLKVDSFIFVALPGKTLVQVPISISFYSFHFLVQWLAHYKPTTLGIVETPRTIYTTYRDPNSENLIGQTDKGKKFFISLTEDYSRLQFLRINRYIQTFEEYDVQKIKSEITHTTQGV